MVVGESLTPSPMETHVLHITPFIDEGLGNSSYLVDLGDGRGLVVDPVRDAAPYVQLAAKQGLELARLGATILAPRGGNLAYPHLPLGDATEYDVGGLVVRGIGTPGHTPEHLSYLFLDGDRPLALFSGGALIVGSVARTDLISPEQTEPLARALYQALRDRILPLPDELQ